MRRRIASASLATERSFASREAPTARHRILRAALVAVLSGTCLPLGGCAVSLFSDHELGSEDRIEALEKRMDAIEQRLPPAPPRPASPPSTTPAPAPAGPTK